ncbi:MAG: hypothetical protein IPM57_04905 [Oligoflexia bacterium]|nr:hypothetical protein [Oligoflexia bacterium]
MLKLSLFFILSICFLAQSFASGTKEPHSIDAALCASSLVRGLMSPKTYGELSDLESAQFGFFNYAKIVELQGYIEAERAHKFLEKTKREMEKILQQAKESAYFLKIRGISNADREIEKTFRENLLRIYGNYVFLNKLIEDRIKTKEEIQEASEADVEAQLDKEFNVKKPLLN